MTVLRGDRPRQSTLAAGVRWASLIGNEGGDSFNRNARGLPRLIVHHIKPRHRQTPTPSEDLRDRPPWRPSSSIYARRRSSLGLVNRQRGRDSFNRDARGLPRIVHHIKPRHRQTPTPSEDLRARPPWRPSSPIYARRRSSLGLVDRQPLSLYPANSFGSRLNDLGGNEGGDSFNRDAEGAAAHRSPHQTASPADADAERGPACPSSVATVLANLRSPPEFAGPR